MMNLTLTQPVQNWVDTSVDASLPSNSQYFYQILPSQNDGGSNFPTSGLVLFTKFSEGSGNTVADSSGNGHTGYLTNSPAWIPGVTDYALNFVSASQQSAGFGDLNLAGSNQCTFSIWMQKTNPNDIGLAALGCTSGTYNAIFLAWWNDGNVYGGVGFTNAYRYFYAPHVTNTWVHFVMVYDGTQLQNSNRINIFINGIQAIPVPGQANAKTAISTNIGTVSTNFSLAWDSNEGYESGSYDGVGVWNRVLSTNEIQQVYSNAAAGP
ncbi:MAG: LamG-like jellyroll fold domain-containing protein [Verrucomicrobiota bacterium]